MPSPDDAPRPRSGVPAKIGRYRILDRVGRGAMGVVYAAHDDAMGRPVAVKVLMGDLESDPDTRARFYREAQAAAGLLHPNIITIYDAGEDQGRSYIAMQLLEGWPLAAYLKQPEAAPLERKLDLMVQMCEGLGAAHARGIVHRDLKPGNLFVQTDGLLKILDFGVARLADSSMTATGMMIGTPDYMSPEQARGTQVDARSDIFSTGAVFYFMLAGRKPFPGPDLPAVLRQLQTEQPAPLRDTEAPPDLARLVMQALSKDPIDRPPRVQELLAGIIRFRRHYDAGTRKLAVDAAARFNALVAADAASRRAAAALGLPEAGPLQSIESVRARVPSVGERGGAAIESAALDRAQVVQLAAELEAEQQRVDAESARLTRASSLFEDGSRALEAGDGRAALRCLEQVRAEFPDSRAAALAERAQQRAREQDARDREVQELVSRARAALDVRDWSGTIQVCEQVLALVPGFGDATAMLGEAQQGMARDARRRALLLEQALDRAAVAIEEARFNDAALALSEAEALDPQSDGVRELQVDLAEARAAAAEAERIARESRNEIRLARAEFRRGLYEDALARVRTFAGAHPGVPSVVAEIERLEALHARGVEHSRRRQEESARLLEQAAALADKARWDEALAAATDAARRDPSLAAGDALHQLIERALDARLERERSWARDERARAAEPLLAAAREAHTRGYLAVALEAARSARVIAPARRDVAEYIDELDAAMAADDDESVELVGEPYPRIREPESPLPPAAPPPDAPAKPPRPQEPQSEGGVLSHVNQWAADLLRRRMPHR